MIPRVKPEGMLLGKPVSTFPDHALGYAMAVSSTFTAVSGEGYDRVMGRWSARLAEAFLDFSGCADGEDILDAGCGTGSLTSALSRRINADSITAIDFSPIYIDYASQRIRDPRVTFRVGDICALPFADRSFDRVLSLLVLHFVPQSERAVAELRRVARPGATVAAAVWDVRGGYVANRMFYDTAAAFDEEGKRRRARNYTRPMTQPGELAAAWRAAGFTNVRDAALNIRMEFSVFDDFWMPLAGKDGPGAEYLATLSAERRDRLRDLVRDAYLDGEPDGPRSYAATAWAVAGIAPA
jgi:ubiquinone/menaquinone biosynthesis C-methylase UbiE